MIHIRISEDALEDLTEGFLFYEAQQAGLGDYFTACIRSDIESLRITVGAHRIVYCDYYRLLGKIFPFGIFYTFEDQLAVIWAVIDLRSDPEWIKEKMTSKPIEPTA
jgi:hypothetical protein